MSSEDLPFWDHVEEFRRTLLRSLLVITVAFLICFSFYESLFSLITNPLETTSHVEQTVVSHERIANKGTAATVFTLPLHAEAPSILPEGVEEISDRKFRLAPGARLQYEVTSPSHQLFLLSPAEGMMTSLRVSLWAAVVTSSPVWLLFFMSFVAPGLKVRERTTLIPFLLTSCLFFGLGVLFSLYVSIPLANQFFSSFNARIGANFWALSQYVDYSLMLILGNGLAFECLVILAFLVAMGKVSAQTLSSRRRHVIVIILIASAVFTPPDILTQVLLAVPLICFYELAIIYARCIKKKQSLSPDS